MMAVFPSNLLQTVATYQRSGLAALQNLCCHVATANTKFKEFNDVKFNLGSSITFDLPPRAVTAAGLVAEFQPAVQRVLTLAADQSNNSSYAVTAQQLMFNLDKEGDDYLREFTLFFMMELATNVEANVALNWDSSVPVGDSAGLPTSALHTESGPFRFYGNGSTAISSFNQLADMHMKFKNFGAVAQGMKVYLPDTVVPSVVGNGINQFVPRRNDDIAMSWEIGEWGQPPIQYYQSNLMPIHVSGTTGIAGDTLTVVSTNDPTGQNVTQITFSGVGTASDASAVLSGDVFQFQDGVSGQPNMRFLTFIGHRPSANPVQFRATADAASTAGSQVTITFTPALNWAGGNTKNLNNAIVAGMKVLTFPSHRCGGVLGGQALYLAMPRLPSTEPFASANEHDPDTGVSVRMYHGTIFGQNQTGLVQDEVHGSVLVPEYSMRILVPLSQG
jgi:hypothetical protein